jgi:hypothetical protein
MPAPEPPDKDTCPVFSNQEVEGYMQLSQAVSNIEKADSGETVIDDPRVKQAFGAGSNWMLAFQFFMAVQKILNDKGVQEFASKVAPQLMEKIVQIEQQTGSVLTQARALIDGILATAGSGGGGTAVGQINPAIRLMGLVPGAHRSSGASGTVVNPQTSEHAG